MDETAHLYLAEELQGTHGELADDTEFIRTQVFPFATLLRMVMDGEIVDSMTIIAALHVARLRGL